MLILLWLIIPLCLAFAVHNLRYTLRLARLSSAFEAGDGSLRNALRQMNRGIRIPGLGGLCMLAAAINLPEAPIADHAGWLYLAVFIMGATYIPLCIALKRSHHLLRQTARAAAA